jgi:hypothetical protein
LKEEAIMLKTVAITAAVILLPIAGVLVYAATKPDSFRVARTASVKAPPEKISAMIQDFRTWTQWSPFEAKDPAMQRTLSGAPAGKGAIYEWNGNKDIGQGRMEIADVSQRQVRIKLEFIRPFEAHNIAEFTLQPRGEATDVTWAMTGPAPYFFKIVHVFLNMDSMVGKEFETGLANLKTIAER